MGYIAHHAIVISAYGDLADRIAAKATDLGCQVLGPLEQSVNGDCTIVICPDGSKEGWEPSTAGDKRRDLLIEWLQSQAFTYAPDYVEVRFGGDEPELAAVTRTTTRRPE